VTTEALLIAMSSLTGLAGGMIAVWKFLTAPMRRDLDALAAKVEKNDDTRRTVDREQYSQIAAHAERLAAIEAKQNGQK